MKLARVIERACNKKEAMRRFDAKKAMAMITDSMAQSVYSYEKKDTTILSADGTRMSLLL